MSFCLSSGGDDAVRLNVGPEGRGRRLDAFLSAEFGLSRSKVKKAVQEGRCLVNGRLCVDADLRLEPGMDLTFGVPRCETVLEPEAGELDILYRDEHMAVVNKPPHLTVHPCPSCPEGTLVHRLLARVPELGRLEGLRPGIVHRLDKDTSGLLVVALTESARAGADPRLCCARDFQDLSGRGARSAPGARGKPPGRWGGIPH